MIPWDLIESNLRAVFDQGIFANNGPFVRRVDELLGAHVDGFGISVCSPMMAMMLSSYALFSEGTIGVDGALSQPFAEALRWAGFDAFVHAVEATGGIVAMHGNGRGAAEMERLAKDRNVRLIFYGADILSDAEEGRKVGTFGDATIFTFGQGDSIDAGGAAAVVTRDEDVSNVLRSMRNFHPSQTFAPTSLRMNGKMAEAPAAIIVAGLSQILGLSS